MALANKRLLTERKALLLSLYAVNLDLYEKGRLLLSIVPPYKPYAPADSQRRPSYSRHYYIPARSEEDAVEEAQRQFQKDLKRPELCDFIEGSFLPRYEYDPEKIVVEAEKITVKEYRISLEKIVLEKRGKAKGNTI